MKDARIEQLAHTIVNYSCSLKKGEKILIEAIGGPLDLTQAIVRAAYTAGGIPHVKLQEPSVQRALLMEATDETFSEMARYDIARMQDMQAYVGVRPGQNATELADVPEDKLLAYNKLYWHPVHSEIRVRKTKWVVLRYPTPSMAQSAGMSTDAFEDFYFDVCNLDYSKMGRNMEDLVSFMQKTDKVRLVGPGTDLSFSIKGIPAVKCCGHMNLPDGEVFTAPVKESVNGTIKFNTPSLHQGFVYTDIQLTFKNGKIIDATCNDTKRLNGVLDTDEGSRYVGEFALGVHPNINKPMMDTLYDEKIAGSIHFTPGNCYDEADNGNKSALHWDLVLIQTPEYGGGEMYFDDVLVRKDGRFVTDALKSLNTENLV